MPGRLLAARLGSLGTIAALAITLAGCTTASAVKPSPSPTPSPSDAPSDTPSATASPSASVSPSASPSVTPDGIDPQFVPALAAIQMIGSTRGYAVGSHAIFATADGTHWVRQFSSTEDFIGVDFINATTGWAVGAHSLLGTSDGGRTWVPLGQGQKPIRSVHFINALEGWGIAGGGDPQMDHGWLVPAYAGTLIHTQDGGHTWSNLSNFDSPQDPQTVCFSDRTHGWLATAVGYIYASHDGGATWTKVLDMFQSEQAVPGGRQTIIECAAPSAMWALMTMGNGAAGHLAYVAYATQDGRSWRTVMAEPFTSGTQLPGVPAGPDSHPGSFSLVDPMDAVFIGDGPATNVAQCVIASNGGATLRRTGRIDNSAETFGAAFVSVTTGWVLTRNAGGDYVIDITTDGGYHWAQQLAVPPTSAG